MTRTLKIWCGALALMSVLVGCVQAAPQDAPEAAEQTVLPVEETQPEPVYEKHEAYMSAENGFFEPEKPLTRAQAAQMVCTLAGLTGEDAPDTVYADVAPENWYYAPVHTAAAYFEEAEAPTEEVAEDVAEDVASGGRTASVPAERHGTCRRAAKRPDEGDGTFRNEASGRTG